MPMVAEPIVSGFGETLAPKNETVRANGASATSDVRRASTVTSQTPGSGLLVVRLSGLQVTPIPPWAS